MNCQEPWGWERRWRVRGNGRRSKHFSPLCGCPRFSGQHRWPSGRYTVQVNTIWECHKDRGVGERRAPASSCNQQTAKTAHSTQHTHNTQHTQRIHAPNWPNSIWPGLNWPKSNKQPKYKILAKLGLAKVELAKVELAMSLLRSFFDRTFDENIVGRWSSHTMTPANQNTRQKTSEREKERNFGRSGGGGSSGEEVRGREVRGERGPGDPKKQHQRREQEKMHRTKKTANRTKTRGDTRRYVREGQD